MFVLAPVRYTIKEVARRLEVEPSAIHVELSKFGTIRGVRLNLPHKRGSRILIPRAIAERIFAKAKF